MAKKGQKTVQMNVRLPPPVVKHVHDRYHDEGWDRPLQVIAAILAFDSMDELAKKRYVQLATQVDIDHGAWKAVLERVTAPLDSPLDDRRVGRLLRALVQYHSKPEGVRRRA
jgi:hypothetical protein